MFILHLKRLKIILGFVLISLFAFSCTYVKNENKTVEVTATPVSGKTVILDAGHRFS